MTSRSITQEGAAPGAVHYASWIRRASAVALDGVVIWFVVFVATLSFGENEDASAIAFIVAAFLFPAAYATLAHGGRHGKTIGKAVFGIAVRNERTYGPLGYGRAFLRWLVTFALWVFTIPGLLDALSPLWRERNRAWHDAAARSIVVRL